MSLIDILSKPKEDKQIKLDEIGRIRDLLDYGNLDMEEALNTMNLLAENVVLQEDNDIKEAMLNAILEGESSYDLDVEIDLKDILANLSMFNDECISYILTMLGYTGKEEYREIIQSFSNNPKLSSDVEEALLELNHALKK
ncbi:hypothetical protein [Listeria grandensis]|uniref:hypothetical protein n=1 Tax=Listeria grandensis TaxID=1494963 RepID=UPI00164D87E3|nr:hypothetical protein [Listeria grandensis]MBC6316527.1 hypothetical protein [Listeria grandensis]